MANLKPVLDFDALLVSDGNPTYTAFCKAENISHESISLRQKQRVRGAYHVQNINGYHRHFKRWLGWCRVMEYNKNLIPELLLNSALGNFQHLKGT